MGWPRDVVVTIAGTDYTTDAIDAVEVNMGARTPWEQTVNGAATVLLKTEQPDIEISDLITIDVDDQTGTPVRIFTGRVGSYSTGIYDFGPVWTVRATGPLTQAGRRRVGTAVPADTEGDQIAELAQTALGTQWQETPGTYADQTLTWAGFAVDTSAIDQPGLYDLAAISDTDDNVLDALALAAYSGSGWLYETRDGLLGYGDSTSRENTPFADYIEIPGSIVAQSSWQSSTSEADLVTQATVTYDGGQVNVEATAALAVYGRWQRTYGTSLADAGDAATFAGRQLELQSAPRRMLAGGIRTRVDLATDDLIDQFLTVERNYGVVVEDVPTYIAADGVYRGFIEGYYWVLDRYAATLDLFVSDYFLSNFGLRWAAAGPTPWNGVGASLTWQDATEALA